MQSKLILSIDKEIIERAKAFASRSNRSLSEIIDSYLVRITDKEIGQVDSELSKLVGVIDLHEEFNEKEEFRRILREKHL